MGREWTTVDCFTHVVRRRQTIGRQMSL